jgi:hypothetical protein
MSREGPINFGKPVLYLVIAGCIGGGTYAYLNWPSVYEQVQGNSMWTVRWPHGWETTPDPGPEGNPSRVKSSGPLIKDEFSGLGWGKTEPHGQLIWPDMVVAKIGGTPDKVEWDGFLIDNKRALRFEYEDNENRYLGCAIERGDVLIYVAIGCQKARFSEFYSKFEKCIMGVTCTR